MINLSNDESVQAVKDWAKDDIVKLTLVRIDIAKFFFSVSTFSLGFLATTWKLLHDKTEFPTVVNCGLSLLAISLIISIFIFWPIFYKTELTSDLISEHSDMASRIKCEGGLWIIVWLLGTGLCAYGIFFYPC